MMMVMGVADEIATHSLKPGDGVNFLMRSRRLIDERPQAADQLGRTAQKSLMDFEKERRFAAKARMGRPAGTLTLQ